MDPARWLLAPPSGDQTRQSDSAHGKVFSCAHNLLALCSKRPRRGLERSNPPDRAAKTDSPGFLDNIRRPGKFRYEKKSRTSLFSLFLCLFTSIARLTHFLGAVTGLEALDLTACQLTSTRIRSPLLYLSGLKSLKCLRVSRWQVSSDLHILAGMTRLRTLSLDGCNVTDEGLSSILSLSSLHSLSLSDSKVSHKSVRYLPFATPLLTHLVISSPYLSDEALESIASFSSLRSLGAASLYHFATEYAM